MQQILFNLLSNAKDATENRENRTIEIGLNEHASDQLMLFVKDNGVGIPKNIIHRIVEPFFTTKAVGKGTGIGLGMVKNFVEMLKGHIEIESVEGQGSIFKIFLPISKKMDQTSSASLEKSTNDELKKVI